MNWKLFLWFKLRKISVNPMGSFLFSFHYSTLHCSHLTTDLYILSINKPNWYFWGYRLRFPSSFLYPPLPRSRQLCMYVQERNWKLLNFVINYASILNFYTLLYVLLNHDHCNNSLKKHESYKSNKRAFFFLFLIRNKKKETG